jgi:hypothetical protein
LVERNIITIFVKTNIKTMKDLFETPELIPTEVQAILETFDEDSGNTYFELDRILSELEPLGYIFDYYLDAEPYGLRPINMELEELEGWENCDNN